MMIERQWVDVPEVFEPIADALSEVEDITTYASYEQSEYGENGFITIRTQDGRRFRLQLRELV